MISLELARRLRDGGVRWTPSSGDRFVVIDRDMDDDVFVVSEMTVDVYPISRGHVIRFNGTTEWALDSIEQRESVWLPSETQLRELLGGTFRYLHRQGAQWRVTIEVEGRTIEVHDGDVAQAYGIALLHLVTGADVAA